MADCYSQSVIRAAVGQICKNVGFDSISSSALEILVDFAERHSTQIGKKSRRYAEQFGRADPTIDDLEMAFKEADVNANDLLEFRMNTEQVTLQQPVHEYPVDALPAAKLFIPQLDDDGKIITAAKSPLHSMSRSNSRVENSSTVNKPTEDCSPGKSVKSSGLMEGVVNTRFRMRTDLMVEDGQVSSLFNQGKPPSLSRPPKPLHEVNIPKLNAEPSSKPKIKTGVLKPKPKALPAVVPSEEEALKDPEIVEAPSKQKPLNKGEKRKKKKAMNPPEGFTDIFGQPLEKPSKASKTERPGNLGDNSVDRPASTSSHQQDVIVAHDGENSANINLSDDANILARMRKVDDTIDSVLASYGKHVQEKDAYVFEEEQVSPGKATQKSPSKKWKNSGQSRSPSKKSLVERSSDEKKSESKKDKSKKKSRRTQLLEKFAAAPIADFHSEEPQSTPVSNHAVVSDGAASPDYSSDTDSKPPQEITQPDHKQIEDEEDDIVNVDECSDVDILDGSSPALSPHNPFHAYTNSAGADTPVLPEADTPVLPEADTPVLPEADTPVLPEEPITSAPYMEHNDTPPCTSAENQWGINANPDQHLAQTWQESNIQTIDFGPQLGVEDVVKKEKHKKEKKEKKEKKKKKHKERDKDRQGGKHKAKREKGNPSPVAVDDSTMEAQDAIPRLTLKVPQEADLGYSQSYSELETSYPGSETQHYDEAVPRLVIKPIAPDEVTAYLPPQAPPVGIYPETSAFDAHEPFPATTQYAEPVPDEDGKIWICPWCSKVDDGSPMIGCDGGCDEWFHWSCVGITQQPPEDVEWFCKACSSKDKKKRKKRKKDKR